MSRPILASVDLDALRHNYLLARTTAPKSKCFAVMKADAYGHGIVRCAQALQDIADAYAMLDFDEAQSVRDAGITQSLLMLEGIFNPNDLKLVQQLQLMQVVHNAEQLRMLELTDEPGPFSVFLKMNSGMNRLGFPPREFLRALERLQQNPRIGEIVLMTHFANADTEGSDIQIKIFQDTVRDLPYQRSLCNSAGLLRYPATHEAWVRPGIMLYGSSPFAPAQVAAHIGLRPVMHLNTELISIQEVAPGMRVGYGGIFIAPQTTRIGIVACGYADGYPRHAPTGTPLVVEGIRTRTLGRVSMDMIACDLSEIPHAKIGSPVQMWGDLVSADEVAASAGTLAYELFCALAPRVPVKAL